MVQLEMCYQRSKTQQCWLKNRCWCFTVWLLHNKKCHLA